MMHKLMQPLQAILTGHSKIIIIVFLFVATSCRFFSMDKFDNPEYFSYIVNGTNQELKISTYLPYTIVEDTILQPDNEIMHRKGLIDKTRDPLKDLLDKIAEDTLKVYVDDVLKKTWYKPTSDLDSSEHHFFNYNSWKINIYEKDDVNYYYLKFTITEEDLQELKIDSSK